MKNLVYEQIFDEERSLYNIKDTEVLNCKFEGPADGESVLKECRNFSVNKCSFSLRYPMWHAKKFLLKNSSMDEKTRAPLWYCKDGEITDCDIQGIKCLRECKNISVDNSHIISPEFGWRCKGVKITNSTIDSMYFLFESKDVEIENLTMTGRFNKDTTFDKTDFRSTIPRFSHENLQKNIVLVDYVKELADRKGTTPARVALAWLLHQKPWIVPIPGTKKVERLQENIGAEDITFTQEELADIRKHIENIEITGARYPEEQEKLTGL